MKELVKHKGPTAHAIEREKARRRFMDAKDIRAEVERCVQDPADIALDEAVRGMTGDPWQQEAHIARVNLMADDLAGGSDDPTVRMWCRMVAQYRFYSCYADFIFHETILKGISPGVAAFRNLAAFREGMAREFRKAVKSLADVKRVPVSEIEASVNRLRVVG
jgi:hypothetical protein